MPPHSKPTGTVPATNVDWYDEVLRDSGYVIDGDVTFRGGTQTARYNVVLNYLNQQGLFDVSNSDSRSNRTYERYGLRANLDFTMFKFIEARVDLGGRIERGKRPNITIDDLFYNMARYPSNIYEIWDDEAHTPLFRYVNLQQQSGRFDQCPWVASGAVSGVAG